MIPHIVSIHYMYEVVNGQVITMTVHVAEGISYNNNGAGVSVRITVSKGLSWNDHKQCDSDVYDIPGTAFC